MLTKKQILLINKIEKRKLYYQKGGKDMYKYTFSEDDAKDITSKTSVSENILNKFKDVDEKYNQKRNRISTVEKPELEKINYTAPTEDQIREKAENSLQEYKQTNQEKINKEYETNTNKINDQIETAKKDVEEDKSELENLYGSLKKNASDDATKRGLARSSIIVNQLNAFDKDMLNTFMEIDKNYKETLSELSTEKELLEVQKQNALSSFDIGYAIKLDEKISSLNQDIYKKEEEVLKYNNQIAEKEAQWLREQEDLNNKYAREDAQDAQDFLEYITKNGTVAYEDTKAKEKYELAYEQLKNVPKKEAIDEINNNTDYKKHLGRYFETLLSLLQNRED